MNNHLQYTLVKSLGYVFIEEFMLKQECLLLLWRFHNYTLNKVYKCGLFVCCYSQLVIMWRNRNNLDIMLWSSEISYFTDILFHKCQAIYTLNRHMNKGSKIEIYILFRAVDFFTYHLEVTTTFTLTFNLMKMSPWDILV